jgi:hypothetical protein
VLVFSLWSSAALSIFDRPIYTSIYIYVPTFYEKNLCGFAWQESALTIERNRHHCEWMPGCIKMAPVRNKRNIDVFELYHKHTSFSWSILFFVYLYTTDSRVHCVHFTVSKKEIFAVHYAWFTNPPRPSPPTFDNRFVSLGVGVGKFFVVDRFHNIHDVSITDSLLTLILLMSYIYGAPSKARNLTYIYGQDFYWGFYFFNREFR